MTVKRRRRRHSGHRDLLGRSKSSNARPARRLAERRSEALKVRGGELAALAHDLVADLLPLAQAAHAGTLDGRNMHEHVFAAVIRLNEAETLLGIEKLDCPLSHVASDRYLRAAPSREPWRSGKKPQRRTYIGSSS